MARRFISQAHHRIEPERVEVFPHDIRPRKGHPGEKRLLLRNRVNLVLPIKHDRVNLCPPTSRSPAARIPTRSSSPRCSRRRSAFRPRGLNTSSASSTQPLPELSRGPGRWYSGHCVKIDLLSLVTRRWATRRPRGAPLHHEPAGRLQGSRPRNPSVIQEGSQFAEYLFENISRSVAAEGDFSSFPITVLHLI